MAQWMIAESFFHQREYATAVSEYQKVETQHSFPTWQALALLQMGKCHEQVGNWTAATDVYARLVKTFPSSSHANEAASRLQAAREQALRK